MIPIELPRASGIRPLHFTILTASLVVLTLAYMAYVGARWSGYWRGEIVWTDDRTEVAVSVNDQDLLVPASLMRSQMAKIALSNGRERLATLKLAAIWPTMTAARSAQHLTSADLKRGSNLVLIDITANQGAETMRDRLETVYRRLARGPETDGPAGLKVLTLSSPVALELDQVVFEPNRANGFIARCKAAQGTNAVCHRAASADGDLAVSYRFERGLLSSWGRLDRRVNDLVEALRQ
ncbi:hypothetical protein [uncultured Roseibium sp.]|uniref:hypothetical protein n=1 Tax=uncultured Roseibium sp. TaxID=1936171 RepID=UPI00259A936C|nr:hypothetical protein [uncultured Roseibium sp.]